MKRTGFRLLLLSLCLCTVLTACASKSPDPSDAGTVTTVSDASAETTSAPYVKHVFEGTEAFDNLTFSNGEGRMGDTDGPAYCVYSQTGYTGASIDLQLSDLELNIFKPDGTHVNAYLFLGADVYSGDGNWVNCADAGLCYSGHDGWHVFYNLYSVADPDKTSTWYESWRQLSADCDYRLTMDCTQKEGYAVLTVYNLTEGKIADRAMFELQYAKTDGSNTSFLTDFALDYPEELRKDPSGVPSEDWAQVTLFNTDQGVYMKNICVYNAALLKNGQSIPWTTAETQNRGMWPDRAVTEIDYPCTSVHHADGDSAYIVDLDMNRRQ